jgi:hypothetical protein
MKQSFPEHPLPSEYSALLDDHNFAKGGELLKHTPMENLKPDSRTPKPFGEQSLGFRARRARLDPVPAPDAG